MPRPSIALTAAALAASGFALAGCLAPASPGRPSASPEPQSAWPARRSARRCTWATSPWTLRQAAGSRTRMTGR